MKDDIYRGGYTGPRGPKPETLDKFNRALKLIQKGMFANRACREVGMSQITFIYIRRKIAEQGPIQSEWENKYATWLNNQQPIIGAINGGVLRAKGAKTGNT